MFGKLPTISNPFRSCSKWQSLTSSVVVAPSPAAPKLDSRFVISSVPTRPSCNILALQPGYRPTRQLSAVPRIKEVYVEEFEGNDGYRQKVPWHARGFPCFDEEALSQLEQRMNQAAEEVKQDWHSRRADIEKQMALDLAMKKEENQKKVDAKHAAERAAASLKPRKKRPENPSPFLRQCFPSFLLFYSPVL